MFVHLSIRQPFVGLFDLLASEKLSSKQGGEVKLCRRKVSQVKSQTFSVALLRDRKQPCSIFCKDQIVFV